MKNLIRILSNINHSRIQNFLEYLIIPSPVISLPIIKYFQNFIVGNTFMIYIIYIVPAFLFSLSLYAYVKTKEENKNLHLKIKETQSFINIFNAYWNKHGEPHCLACKSALSLCLVEVTYFYKSECLYCAKCNSSIQIVDEYQNIIPYKTAKSLVIRTWLK